MRTKHLVLLGVILMQICFVQALHYDLTTLLDQQNELDCENTDFVQMLQDFESWGEIIELLQDGQLDSEMKQLQELSEFTNEMISANPNDLMEDPSYDEQLETMDEQLQTIQNQYNGPQRKFLFEQSRQISDQIRRVIESRSFEQKRSQLAMLYGLIEYLLKQISRVQNQYYNQLLLYKYYNKQHNHNKDNNNLNHNHNKELRNREKELLLQKINVVIDINKGKCQSKEQSLEITDKMIIQYLKKSVVIFHSHNKDNLNALLDQIQSQQVQSLLINLLLKQKLRNQRMLMNMVLVFG